MELQNAWDLAREKMDQHDLKSWKLDWINSNHIFGQCDHAERTIRLSPALVSINDEKEVLDTILHEIAHAVCGGFHGHNWFWRREAQRIGARPEPCYSDENVNSAMPWHGVCPKGHRHYRQSTPGKYSSCLTCCKTYNPSASITWKFVPSDKNISMRAALISAKALLKK